MMFNRTLTWLGFILSFLIPTILATNYTLNNIYISGPHGYDAGWFAYLISHATQWPLPNPSLFGGTFFSTHMSLIFYLYSAIYHGLNGMGFTFPPSLFFGVTQGVWFGLLSLSAYGLFLPCQEKRNSIHICLAFIFSLLTVANGVSFSIMAFPHIEIGIPALLIAFFALWVKRFHTLCYLPLIMGLMMREDAGLHYAWAFILVAIAFYCFSRKAPAFKNTTHYFSYLAILCFSYSVAIIVLQTLWFHSHMLSNIYVGSPPFHHVTWAFIKHRFLLIILTTPYIYVPLFISAFLAYAHRDPLQALGLFFILPWMTFSFFAVAVGAGTLMSYYAFPILISFLWPAIAYGLTQKYEIALRSYIAYWKDGCIILVSSLLSAIALLVIGYFVFSLTLPPHFLQDNLHNIVDFRWTQHWKKDQHTLDMVFSTHQLGEHFMVDSAVAGLEIDNITSKNFHEKDSLPSPPSATEAEAIDLMVFLPHLRGDSRVTEKIITMAHLTVTCPLPGSRYRIAKKQGTHPELCHR